MMVRILFIMMLPFMCFSQITPREDIPVNNILKEKENLNTKRKAFYNLDEIKVRWKKAALENCPGVPCMVTTIPGAPTGVVATAGNTLATVTFVTPTNNGGSAITGYTVTTNPGGITAMGATSPINVTGLTNGTAYTFTVTATNAVGSSVASVPSTSVTPVVPATTPDPPTGIVATACNTTASVAFVAPTNNGGSAITGYTVTSNPGGITATGATSPIKVTGLTNGTAYTFTLIATNVVGSSLVSVASMAVTPTPTITDIDGNSYNIVTIGSQCWTKENLKVTKYNDNTVIPIESTGGSGGISSTWQNLTTGSYAIYENETSSGTNATNYGYLYNWYAAKGIATTGSTTYKNLCPTGYHVPTDSEWTTLTTYLGGVGVAGGKMKSIGTTLWQSPNTGATDESAFSALPGGGRFSDGMFFFIMNSTYFWSASENAGTKAWFRNLISSDDNVTRSSTVKSVGVSVRCLKD